MAEVKNSADVCANFAASGGFWEARGAPEICALVYAPAAFPRNPSCRLHDVGGCPERAVKQHVEWRACENDLMSVALALFPTSKIGLRNDALV